MRILFYVEPLIECDRPRWKAHWITSLVARFVTALRSEGVRASDLACITTNALGAIARQSLPDVRLATIDQTELVPRFGRSALQVAQHWHAGTLGAKDLSDMAGIVRRRLGRFRPDLCVTFSPAPFIRTAYPEAGMLHVEYGMLSRVPFPETIYFDPHGTFRSSTLAVHADAILAFEPDQDDRRVVEEIRGGFAPAVDPTRNPLAAVLGPASQRFESMLLLPLQLSDFYGYQASARFLDQYDLVVQTLEAVPRSVGVVVTEHPEFPVLGDDAIGHLRDRYPNFVWHPFLRTAYAASHLVMPYVQGVVAVSSSVGLQALLWKKRLAVPGSSHLDLVCDTHDIAELPSHFGAEWPASREAVLTWLLTRFHLPLEPLLASGRLLDCWRRLSDGGMPSIDGAARAAGLDSPTLAAFYAAAATRQPASAAGRSRGDPSTPVSIVYVKSHLHSFSEATCIRRFVSWGVGQAASLAFEVGSPDEPAQGLRLDPLDGPGAVLLRRVAVNDAHGRTVWRWDGGVSTLGRVEEIVPVPLEGDEPGLILLCVSEDPRVELPIDAAHLGAAPHPLTVHVDLEWPLPHRIAQARRVELDRHADLARRVVELDGHVVLMRDEAKRQAALASQSAAQLEAVRSDFARQESEWVEWRGQHERALAERAAVHEADLAQARQRREQEASELLKRHALELAERDGRLKQHDAQLADHASALVAERERRHEQELLAAALRHRAERSEDRSFRADAEITRLQQALATQVTDGAMERERLQQRADHELEALRGEVRTLGAQNAALRDGDVTLRQALSESAERNASLAARLELRDGDVVRLREAVDQCRAEADRSREALQQLERIQANDRVAIEVRDERIAELLTELADAQRLADDLVTKRASAQAEIERMIEADADHRQRAVHHAARMADLEAQLSKVRSESAEHAATSTAMDRERLRIADELRAAQSMLHATQEQRDRLESRVHSMTVAGADAESRQAVLEQEVLSLRAGALDAQQRQAQWQRTVRALGDAITQMRSQLEGGRRAAPTEIHVDSSVSQLAGLDGQDFLRQAYRTILRREPDADGFRHYSAVLQRHGKVRVLADLSDSQEAQRIGQRVLGLEAARKRDQALKLPVFGPLLHRLGLRGTGPVVSPVIATMLAAPQTQFLHSAYRLVLGREPDPAGLRHYGALLREGVDRVSVLSDLRRSTEGAARREPVQGFDDLIATQRGGAWRRWRRAVSPAARVATLRTIVANQTLDRLDEADRRATELEGRFLVTLNAMQRTLELQAAATAPPVVVATVASPGAGVDTPSASEPALQLVPLNDVQPAADGTWRATGIDPQFEILGADVLTGRWVAISLRFVGDGASEHSAKMYVDSGRGLSEDETVHVPLDEHGCGSLLWEAPPTLVQLRIDPPTVPGAFRFDATLMPMPNLTSASAASGAAAFDAALTLEGASPAAAVTMKPLTSGASAAMPLISVILPTYNTPAALLEETLASVYAQTYPNWELCICDDASTAPHLREQLERHAEADARVRLVFRTRNGNISAATNDALAIASGDYVAFLDHDDLLTPDALLTCADALMARGADVVYSDQDTVDERGERLHVFHKPVWSPEYLRHVMYVGHLLVVRRSLVAEAGGLDSRFDGVQDFELMLRLGERTDRIEHLPRVLYHWRAIAGSLAQRVDAKDRISELQAAAVQAHLDRLHAPATAEVHPQFPHRCRTVARLDRHPRVSIIIPSRDQPNYIGPCLESIFGTSTYPDIEVIVVDNGTTNPEALRILQSHPVKVIAFNEKFNYSRANNLGAANATGEILLFLNNDTAVITPDWLESMVYHLQYGDVGAVGAMLLYENRTVQHAGVVLGARGTADHLMRGFPEASDGYAGSLSCAHEVSVVTAACLALRRADFDRIGGFSELYGTHYQDVDFCLRLRALGRRNVYAAEARLFHFESVSRGKEYDLLDRALLQDTWREWLTDTDPYYPRPFSLVTLDYALEAARA